MKSRIASFLSDLSTSFWFVPTLLAVGAIALSFATLALDATFKDATTFVFGYDRGTDGARTLLSAAASSVITVAGVTFSITIATLAQASSQFGPRLLRNFMSDKGNQLVLGTFTATFLYCLLVLRAINGTGSTPFVPHISVSIGLLLAVLSIGVLIYFIHHVSTSLQADYVIATASRALNTTITRLFPENREQGREGHKQDIPEDFDRIASPVPAVKSGYLQTFESEELTRLATKYDVLLRVECETGAFVVQGRHLVLLWPARQVDDKLRSEIQRAFLIGIRRTTTHDIDYAIDQLVEVAVRALSPGINDPFTAMSCIDWLGEAFSQLEGRTLPSPYHYDEKGILRLITPSVTFQRLADAAFTQIRQAARTNPTVTMHLLKTIATMISSTNNQEMREELFYHATFIEQGSRQGLPDEVDQQRVKELYQEVARTLL
jgi:uncharacterized membrane protein